ncbi:MAG: thermonuclease family protein [Hyphomonadaceae bacterium]
MKGFLFPLIALASALAACGPQIDDLEAGESGRVAEIVDGDTLVLDTGLRVTLTGIEAPFGDRAFAREARAGLERLALHRPVRLAYGGEHRVPPRSPVGPRDAAAATPAVAVEKAAPPGEAAPAPTAPGETALAQVYVQSEGGRWIWVQQAMLVEGLARVRTRKENFARADDLLAAEAQARAERRGLWALRDYRILTDAAAVEQASTLPNRCGEGPFLIVEGRVRQVSANDERVYLNFGEDYRTDFTIGIYGEDVADWSGRGPAFASYEGQRVRVRGRAANRGGPLICADHPEQIEILTAS